MPFDKRCGTCELLVRSSSRGLDSWGKCPHRTGWVRTFDDACQEHTLEKKPQLWVNLVIAANVAAALLAYVAFAVIDLRGGNVYSHLMVGGAPGVVGTFVWYVHARGLASEDAKYLVLENTDPPPEDEEPWWRDNR